jgi:hypothetical protein
VGALVLALMELSPRYLYFHWEFFSGHSSHLDIDSIALVF